MYLNAEDIQWFKPVELRTKFGRRGHIKEPLGEGCCTEHSSTVIMVFVSPCCVQVHTGT